MANPPTLFGVPLNANPQGGVAPLGAQQPQLNGNMFGAQPQGGLFGGLGAGGGFN